MKHENNGFCNKCDTILNRYSGIYGPLYSWFRDLQRVHPEAHVSCAGRGELDQEAAVVRRASRAHWKQSAHNYNAALDIFECWGDIGNIYEVKWFNKVLAPNIPDWMEWYGKPGSKFFELPHVQVKNWKELVLNGSIKLVKED